ncbi:helix-turn-helix transcriptional regulator [Pseudoxanthomonas wuyuanensis]|uniref:AraC-type DNA-binding protein n=1 Tax=Pseudoxanthomonas wuyuanensis TaxID=1073196 RepID=A0A286D2X8_9GAMM|nr:helix-turn-helix transcriptional regulator [Pseudoxanthomonas wuyuanensis]KAF1723041.1 AraC family transcriptional regulator [Pseudoxanthomonas wuyuanensis]SOD53015.1 AraC-type DNA-binding protein [Pseudoxanthomonas wuyuanensis]
MYFDRPATATPACGDFSPAYDNRLPAAATAIPPALALRYSRLRLGEALSPEMRHPDVLHLVHGSERGARLRVPRDWLSVSLPLGAQLRVDAEELGWPIERGSVLVWRGAVQLASGNGGHWLSLCGSPQAWHRAGADAGLLGELFADEGRCPPLLARFLVRMAQALRKADGTGVAAPELLAGACVLVHEQQRPLRELLPRCSGRTTAARRRTLARLLRIQHLIRSQIGRSPDMAWLSRQGNYSTWHLSRIYRAAFGHTPSEYAARLRLQRALHLVRDTALPFCEITEACGFESQSSFCRAFKQFSGMTPGAARSAAIRSRAAAGIPC